MKRYRQFITEVTTTVKFIREQLSKEMMPWGGRNRARAEM